MFIRYAAMSVVPEKEKRKTSTGLKKIIFAV